MNSKLVAVTPGSPARELIPHDEETRLESILAMKDYLIVLERVKGLQQIAVYDFVGKNGDIGNRRVIRMPEESYSLSIGWSPYDHSVLRYHYTSMTTPSSTYDVDLSSLSDGQGTTVLKKQQVNYLRSPPLIIADCSWRFQPRPL